MAKLCVRLEPNGHPDPKLNALRTHPGDVVSVVDDDHQFTFAEMALYHIIEVPGVRASEFAHLHASVLDAEGVHILRRRALRLDLDAMAPAIARRRSARHIATRDQIVAMVRARE